MKNSRQIIRGYTDIFYSVCHALPCYNKREYCVQVKALTACFWSDFMLNPSIMYGLFANTPHKLTYDPDRVKVMGTEAGMIK